MLASMATREMVPIGVVVGFLGAAVSGAVSVVSGLTSFFDAVGGGGRQIMHPIKHFSRNSRQALALAVPWGTGMKGTAFW